MVASRASWMVGLIWLSFVASAAAQICPEDLDGNERVSIDELVTLVELGATSCMFGFCPGDTNHDDTIGATEIVAAAQHALTDCNLWTPGVFASPDAYAARCQQPRSGIDPLTEAPYADVQGSTVDENNWLRAWTNATYLWYREVPDVDPSQYDTRDYFEFLKTAATTASGRYKDRFHFTIPTDEYIRLSQSGSQIGYGAEFALLSGPRLVVAYSQAGTPAGSPPLNLSRGALILAVDGVDVMTQTDPGSVNKILSGLFPTVAGEAHTFTILDAGASTPRNARAEAAVVEAAPVLRVGRLTKGEIAVGYILFNAHIATAEGAMIEAIGGLRDAGINDLVLDVRYNTGGYVVVASEVAYMIAGRNRTVGRVFERDVFNDRYRPRDQPFQSAAVGLSAPEGQALPTLDLARVFILTGPNTCSASESIINSLRGIDVQVIQIGATTCGKPYVFFPEDNCGTTYFTIQVQAVNAKGFGAYDDGFVPQTTPGAIGAVVPGCAVPDDFTHTLGDPAEARLNAALYYRDSGTCPPASRARNASPGGEMQADLAATEASLFKFAWEDGRLRTNADLDPLR